MASENGQVPGLSPLEQEGVLFRQLIHDFSNHLAIVAGNAQAAEASLSDPATLQQALRAIGKACARANEFLTAYEQLPRDAQCESPIIELVSAVQTISEANPEPAGWELSIAGTLRGQIAAEARWIAFAVWQLVREAGTPNGEIRLMQSKFPNHLPRPPRLSRGMGQPELFQIEIRWESPAALLPEHESSRPTNIRLAIVFGVLRWLNGWPIYRFAHPNRHWCLFCLPLVEPGV